MPNDLPYMPTFIGDFMAAVTGWPPDRVGAYWLALMYQWENGGVPAANERELAAILHTSRPVARRLWGEIAAKFHKRADGRWWNAKAEAVRLEAKRQFAMKVERGKKGANARWGKGSNEMLEQCLSNAQAMPEQCLSNANQNHNQSTPPKPPASAGGSRRRRRVFPDPWPDQQAKSREVKRLMDEEGLTFVEASKRVGFQ